MRISSARRRVVSVRRSDSSTRARYTTAASPGVGLRGCPATSSPTPPTSALEAVAPLAQRLRPHTLDEFVGQADVVGADSALRRAIASDRVPSMIFFGPPGSGKTTLARIVASTTQAHFEELSAVQVGVGRRAPRAGRGARPAGRQRPAHDPVPRRDPPLQQGPAGRAPARGRVGARDPDRRDHGEPVLRGQLRAAQPLPAVRAQLARAGRPRGDRPPRRGGARGVADRRAARAGRAGRGRRRPQRPERARRRRGDRAAAARSPPSTSATPPASSRSSTTRTATATTTPSRRSSRACAAPTPTPPSTTWR